MNTIFGAGMPTKKMRIDFFNNGDRYTITFEGKITRDKTLRLLDLVELLGGVPAVESGLIPSQSKMSKIDRVQLIVEKSFPLGWFSSKEIQTFYEEKYNQPIRLSTISTYLSRLVDRGFLLKKRVSNQLRYRTINIILQKHLQRTKNIDI